MRAPHLREEMRRRDLQVFHYGMLVLMLAFLAYLIHWHLGHKGQSYTSILILVMLLLSRLMGAYRWPRRVSVALEILWWSGLALTLFFILGDMVDNYGQSCSGINRDSQCATKAWRTSG